MTDTTADWRRILAALANDDAREVYAALVLGDAAAIDRLSPARRDRVLAQLRAAGLVTEADGEARVDPGVFRRALSGAAAPKPRGPERFFDADGRLPSYPANAGDRAAVLTLIAAKALTPGEVLTEAEINERLSAFTDDVAVLRRYLVDHGLVERTRSGSEYAIPEPGGDTAG